MKGIERDLSLITVRDKEYISFCAMPYIINVDDRGRFLVKPKGPLNRSTL